MGIVTIETVKDALMAIGVREGDGIIAHSSFKSFGEIENGAQTIVDGMRAAVGESGTIIFPTLCWENWDKVYENWHLDAQSDAGYLTNYFRKLPGAIRSNQATHSVAAMGKDAAYITKTHGESGLRYGIYGDTPFAADSPWEKMYKMDVKVILLGVDMRKCTLRHYAEYVFMEKYLEKAKKSPAYEAMLKRVWCYERWDDAGVWPHIENYYVAEVLEKEGKLYRATCGDSAFTMVSAKDFVDCCLDLLEKRDIKVFRTDGIWDVQETLDWLKEIDEL